MLFDSNHSIFRSPLLDEHGVKHLVTTRRSFGYSDFNLSRKQQTAEALQQKLAAIERFTRWNKPIVFPRQVSGDNVWHVSDDVAVCDADAVITRRSDIALGILTADCLPVIITDTNHRILALVHAGWRGILANLIGKTVEQMVAMGANPENLIVAIGPSISPDVYEVGNDVATLFAEKNYEKFIKPFNHKLLLDLWGIAQWQLTQNGIFPARTDLSKICTFRNELFYSARRDGAGTGRFATIASLG